MSACTLVLQATIEAKFGKEEQLKWIQDVYRKGFSGTELSPLISDTYLHLYESCHVSIDIQTEHNVSRGRQGLKGI